jgi:hypothetical protein
MAMEAAPSSLEQIFLVRDTKPYKYLPEDAPYLVSAPIGGDEFERLTNSVGKGDRIIIHFLSPNVRRWLAVFNTEATIEWVFWSSDFYTCMYHKYPDYDALTSKYLFQNLEAPLSRFKLLDVYRKMKRQRKEKDRVKLFETERDLAAQKISVFHHYIKEEHALVESMIPLKARFNYFCYSQDIPFNEIYDLSKQLTLAGSPLNPAEPNLMLGNCGYPYINHLDSFDFIKDKVDGVNLVVPLSYGEKPYIEHVIAQGKRMFGERMMPFLDYMSFQQYLVLLMSCQGMLISLSTPKAMGNIHTLLLLGKRVFIKREMLAYAYFERIGVKINAIDEFSEELLMQPEDPAVVASNVKRIIEMHSYAQNYSYVENMIKMTN